MKLKLSPFRFLMTTLLLSSGSLFAQSNQVSLSQLWKTDVKTFLENSPVLAHLTSNSEYQVIIAGREELIALDGEGKEIWKYRSAGRYMMSPSVLEKKGQPPLIYTSDNSGFLRCHDKNGKVVWESKLAAATSWSAPALAELKEDGISVVVQGDESGSIFAMDALTGKMVWKSSVDGKPSGAAIGDLDGIKGLEIAYLTTNGTLTVLHSDGSPYWSKNIGGISQTWGNAAPVIYIGSDGQPRIFAATNNGEAFCFSGSGTQLWVKSVKGAVASTLSVGDIDQDGVADLFLITQLGVIYRFSENGQVLWNIDMQGRTLASGAIADLNGDGQPEYVFSTQDGHLQAIDVNGATVYDFNFGHRTINETPTFGEISKKTQGMEMAISGGESGLVYCFKTSAPINTSKQWITYGGNQSKQNFWTGLTSKSQLSMVPSHLTWNELYLGEDICFDIYNPETTEELINIEASCRHPDGKYQSVSSKLAGHHSQISLPFNGSAPGTYQFNWKLTSPAGKTLLTGKRDINLTPFLNEKSLVQSSISRLKSASEKTALQRPDLSDALLFEAEKLSRTYKVLQPLQELSLAGNQSQQDVTMKSLQLTQKAKKAIKIAELAEASLRLAPNTSILPFEGKLWENRDREEELPSIAISSITLSRSMVAGENEPVSLNLFNLMGRAATARIVADSLPEGLNMVLQHSVPTMDGLGTPSWDALPELGESRTFNVQPFSTEEIWITLTSSANMKPGHYKIPLSIQTLNGMNVQNGPKSLQNVPLPVVHADIELEILNYPMAPQGSIRLCAWANYDAPSIRNLLDHGSTVFIVPQGKTNSNPFMVDFTKMDMIVNELKGNDVFLLLSGLPDMLTESELGKPNNQLSQYLEKLTEHLALKGIDKKHFAFYPYDEPGGSGWTQINKVISFAKMVKAKDPELLVYIDGGGEAPMFKAMQPYVDVWCIGYNVLPDKNEVMDIIRNDQGGMFWTYDCSYSYARPMGANTKNINIIGQYRISALAAFRWNSTGIGYWSYNLGDDMWGRILLEYPLVYPGAGKPVNSRRWEAVREGVEDYRILTNLKAALKNNASPIKTEARQKIEHLLQSLNSLIDQSDREMKLGLSRKVIDVTNNENAVSGIRKEMMECVRSIIN